MTTGVTTSTDTPAQMQTQLVSNRGYLCLDFSWGYWILSRRILWYADLDRLAQLLSLRYLMFSHLKGMKCVLRLTQPCLFYCYSIIIIIIIISFMQGIYTYIPETNYIPMEYSVAAILLLLFMVLISLVPVFNLLYFYISTFRSMCAVTNMAVFCSSFTSCFPCILLTYFLNDFEIVPVAPIITGITFVFTFHMRCISIVRS